jgi:hypothetical protein
MRPENLDVILGPVCRNLLIPKAFHQQALEIVKAQASVRNMTKDKITSMVHTLLS